MLVLLHGFGGAPASWQDVQRELSEPSLAPALLGHDGHSDGSAPIDTFDAEVNRIAAMVPPGSHIVGYSLGGRVALGVAVRHPGRIARCTLISTHPGLVSGDLRAARAAADDGWAERLERDGLASFFAAWESQPMFATQQRLPEETRARQRTIRLAHHPAGLARAMRTLSLGRMPPRWADLFEVQAPVNVVTGSLDATYGALGEQLAAALPLARCTVVPDAGHNVVLEAPRAIARIVMAP
ncbi:alpha/beta fold hydrolase [Pendulispora albinea]|uniref:Alpha/beta fold hydrolase n=1 Tax=Pendulispora albinea TaxID=2741071 RepID=A0ABZ2LT85_9BACT